MRILALPLAALLGLALPVQAQEETDAPSPNQIVDEAPREEWVAIPPENLLVMTLAPAGMAARKVVIQLMPAPFSKGGSRTSARSRAPMVRRHHVNRCRTITSSSGVIQITTIRRPKVRQRPSRGASDHERDRLCHLRAKWAGLAMEDVAIDEDPYADATFSSGWPVGGDTDGAWPVHCYGMVGVGRGYSPDTGSGAELYTVIGHAPRHLDRNIALVGRIVEGMEHLSSLPRGSARWASTLPRRQTSARRSSRSALRATCPKASGPLSSTFRPIATHSRATRMRAPIAAIRSSSSPRAAPISATYRYRCAGWSIERHGIHHRALVALDREERG